MKDLFIVKMYLQQMTAQKIILDALSTKQQWQDNYSVKKLNNCREHNRFSEYYYY